MGRLHWLSVRKGAVGNEWEEACPLPSGDTVPRDKYTSPATSWVCVVAECGGAGDGGVQNLEMFCVVLNILATQRLYDILIKTPFLYFAFVIFWSF